MVFISVTACAERAHADDTGFRLPVTRFTSPTTVENLLGLGTTTTTR